MLQITTEGCDTNYVQCDTKLVPNEAVVEAWAELFMCTFLSHEMGCSLEYLIEQEKAWACAQAKRVLLRQSAMANQTWREMTHAYSYVVIRAALLYNWGTLLSRCTGNTSVSSADLYHFIMESLTDSEFQKQLSSSRTTGHPSFRMTIFGDM